MTTDHEMLCAAYARGGREAAAAAFMESFSDFQQDWPKERIDAAITSLEEICPSPRKVTFLQLFSSRDEA